VRIKILGTRGEIEQTALYHSKHSGILIDGALLVDCGEREFLDLAPRAVLLTHLHPDHAYFVRAGAERPPGGIPLYAPEGFRDYGLEVLEGPATIAGFSVQPVPSHHSLKVRSQAYVIAKGGSKVLYTGDLAWIDKDFRHFFEGLDLVITEASYFRKGGLIIKDKATGQIYGHTGTPDLVRVFKDFCRRIVLVHFGGWFYRDIPRARAALRALGRENGVRIEVGRDDGEIVV
jgi:glyoxylase-like metal-dependent hydrolase (beta-lactamase superfamily II)